MRKSVSAVTVAICSLAIAACAGNNNRPRVVGAAGEIVFKEGNARGEAMPADKYTGWVGLQNDFKEKAETARDGKDGKDPTIGDLKAFMQTGFTLVHLGCNAYIEQKADRQRSMSVARDSFAPFTALITGIIGLANDGDTDSDYLTALALTTTAISAGFDIYEERFLFGANNVNEVRNLILTNQLAHANTAMTEIDQNPSYNQAIIHLMKNQMTCSPAEILEKVNEAIENGTVTAAPVINTRAASQEAIANYEKLLNYLTENELLSEDQLNAAREAIKDGSEEQGDDNAVAPPPATAPSNTNALNSVNTTVE